MFFMDVDLVKTRFAILLCVELKPAGILPLGHDAISGLVWLWPRHEKLHEGLQFIGVIHKVAIVGNDD
jgi:hypothetical protein